MKFILVVLLWWTFALASALATTSLQWARQAQGMLGMERWTRLLRIENTAIGSAYPHWVDALAFEEAGLLWLYIPSEGTQSLSLYKNRLAEEKADLGTLLKAIERGFTRYMIIPDEPATPSKRRRKLPNGCFIECLAALRERVLGGDLVSSAKLLSCYVEIEGALHGHTVLTYATTQGFFLLDPAVSTRPQEVPVAWAEQPEALANIVLQGGHATKTRWIPLTNISPVLVAGLNTTTDAFKNAAPQLMP